MNTKAPRTIVNQAAAMALLIERCRPIILGEVVSAFQDSHDPRIEPEDVVQDILVELWRDRSYVLRARQPHSFVRQIARSTIRKSFGASRGFPVPIPMVSVG